MPHFELQLRQIPKMFDVVTGEGVPQYILDPGPSLDSPTCLVANMTPFGFPVLWTYGLAWLWWTLNLEKAGLLEPTLEYGANGYLSGSSGLGVA